MTDFLRKGNKIHFTSLGCARNLVDTEVMLGIVLKAGYEITDDHTIADFLIVNTCGFLESARQEALDTIDELTNEGKEGAKCVVTGCMVQKHSQMIKDEFPDVHYLLGSGDVEKILEALESKEQGEGVTTARSFLQWGEVPRLVSTPSHYAYLKIAEGCAKRCSFCIIPSIKGPLKSKTKEQVLREFNALLDQGVHEIILIAQDLGDFGKERKENDALEDLLKEILKIDRKFWVRLLYLYPDEITDGLIDVIQNDKRILPYLDMPIQHINPEILKRMRRKTSRDQIIDTLVKLRTKMPEIVIRTSLMVGFPGETEEQFEELLQFIQEHPLDNIGVFSFSPEKGASATRFSDQVPEDVKERRLKTLMEVQMALIEKRNQKYIGTRLITMVEGYHPDSPYLMKGRFYGQCPEVDGQIIINDGEAVEEFGRLHEVEITDVIGYDLIGKAIGPVHKEKKGPSSLRLIHA